MYSNNKLKDIMRDWVTANVLPCRDFVHEATFMGTCFGVIKYPFSEIPSGSVAQLRLTLLNTKYFLLTLDNCVYLCANKEVLRRYVNNLRAIARGE